ncbi:hypothetical protein HWB60_gp022 [Mycobacterium phage TChen]|uniref:Uncharacterized protein n=1 Tax=Mycobacterium phage TChen TaxID=2163598 RepID=A0A2S1PCZ1_9CAUD|nr:hypothetical protein HWB60_gp022 [Mycobacterium phage TChen]AWH14423.1 hypothetical protein SEA_TCHEN_22 [Mycobacterium phage TChen]
MNRCALCGGDWHGLPELVGDRTCPGAWASEEDQVIWRKMFPRREEQSTAPQADRSADQPLGVSPWQFTAAGHDLFLGRHRETVLQWPFRIALHDQGSNISKDSHRHFDVTRELADGGGYRQGGQTITFDLDRSEQFTHVYFMVNPHWFFTRDIRTRYAAMIEPESAVVVAYLDFGERLHVRRSCSLDIEHKRSQRNPFVVLPF